MTSNSYDGGSNIHTAAIWQVVCYFSKDVGFGLVGAPDCYGLFLKIAVQVLCLEQCAENYFVQPRDICAVSLMGNCALQADFLKIRKEAKKRS